jgi:serine/threonine protein kinase
MSMTQVTTDTSPSGDPHCPNCHTVLPPQATFCATCGERIVKKNEVSLLQDNVDITTRYRISSLVRRRPYVSLFFAIDNQQLRPVGIRDIDISSLDKEGRASACDIVQQEYDLLRRESIPSLMPVIEVRHFEGHLYVVSAWPSRSNKSEMTSTHLQTLQDVLQSGIGLPEMQVSLYWVEQLCSTLVNLHQQHIVLGDLDPQALILDSNNYNGDLLLMVSWLPSLVRNILPRTPVVNNATNFSAPEVLLGKSEPRSDIYSLGAVLYLLLTGVPPEEPTARIHRSLRSPGEVNPRINGRLDEFVMKALAIETSERFQDASEMSEVLSRLRAGGKRTFSKVSTALPPIVDSRGENYQADQAHAKERKIDEIANVETVQVTRLSATDLALWEAAKRHTNQAPAVEKQSQDGMHGEIEQVDTIDVPQRDGQVESSQSVEVSTVAGAANISPAGLIAGGTPRFLRQLQRFVLGEQKHSTTAAAIIETPLRVQPDQAYTIRIQLMGRNAPAVGNPQGSFSWPESKKSAPAGLSGLVEGKLVFIEIHSALYQSFAYIVQRATVHIPAQGFAAEVTIPMQPLSSGPSGRRDRLHIFFMDEKRRPLYEKPFIVELFISHLVQPGREGHNVLTIPI